MGVCNSCDQDDAQIESNRRNSTMKKPAKKGAKNRNKRNENFELELNIDRTNKNSDDDLYTDFSDDEDKDDNESTFNKLVKNTTLAYQSILIISLILLL